MKKKTKTKRKTKRLPELGLTKPTPPEPLFEDKTAKPKYCPTRDETLWAFEKGTAGRQYVVEQAMLEDSFNTSSRYGMHRPFKRVVIQAIIFE